MIATASDYQLPIKLEGTILEKIMRAKVHEIIGAKCKLPPGCLEAVMDRAPMIRSFRKALVSKAPAIISEIKQASPSAGVIREEFNPLDIAREYQKFGAAALSVITEVSYFRGGLEILAMLRWNSRVPLLRKDFIVDPYQILEARHAGADAVLLIAALLNPESLRNLRMEAERLGMDVLVEVHDEAELQQALESGTSLIGVNNRDLRTFDVSLDVSMRLGRSIPNNVVAVAESGIRTADDIRRLSEAGFKGFLVGEHLMRSPSPGKALAALLSR